MCGIVGYVGSGKCVEFLYEGLRKLEYRGYDSAGIATLEGGNTRILRAEGKLARLGALIEEKKPGGQTGIGHTRWATHGRPSEANAHPHQYGAATVVHNGIIENHADLRRELENQGHQFSSETDTEIVAHLIDREVQAGLKAEDAVRKAIGRLEGAYAICVLVDSAPNKIIAARHDAPLILGVGENENYVASDIPALLHCTRDLLFLDDHEMAVVEAKLVTVTDREGNAVDRPTERIMWDTMMAEKGGHKHFMLKEIYEQPRAVTDTVRDRLSPTKAEAIIDGFDIDPATTKKITIVACGTSWHSGLVGKYLIEQIARIPVEVDYASEFRYRDPIVDDQNLVVAISQSGETADTLAAVREAKSKGARALSIVNVLGSTIAREAGNALYTHAGPEIGVASTKAFTTQLAALVVLAIYLGRRSGHLGDEDAQDLVEGLMAIPEQMNAVLAREASINVIAKRHAMARDFLFMGRGIHFPIALEGALKLKEISYIHAEAYPGGEMKHGPLALIDENMPVVVIVPQGPGYEKMVNNLTEVRAREGKVIAIASDGDTSIGDIVDDIIQIPDVRVELQPLLSVVPTQLLAYRIADLRGTDVDQPRNLAKSVTVE